MPEPDALSWSAVTGLKEAVSNMKFGTALFDLTDEDHRKKYCALMEKTRHVENGEYQTAPVQVVDSSGKWVADGRYFMMVQWFQVGNPELYIPEEPPELVMGIADR